MLTLTGYSRLVSTFTLHSVLFVLDNIVLPAICFDCLYNVFNNVDILLA